MYHSDFYDNPMTYFNARYEILFKYNYCMTKIIIIETT